MKKKPEGMIDKAEVMAFLGIKESSFKKLIDIGAIVPSETHTFNKWGRTNQRHFYSLEDIRSMARSDIEGLLGQDSNLNAKVRQFVSTYMKGVEYKNSYRVTVLGKSFKIDVTLEEIPRMAICSGHKFQFKISVSDSITMPKRDFCEADFKVRMGRVIEDIDTSEYHIRLERDYPDAIIQEAIQKIDMHFSDGNHLNRFFNRLCWGLYEENKKNAKRKLISDLVRIGSYGDFYPVARSLKRKFHLIVGPTNSGKTYEALESLSEARSGVYLAPLRLMAMETFESLKTLGNAVSLHTGEERIEGENDTHISCTIEMFDETKVVDVAVIDEAQMLSDCSRGWAWSSAIIGVPAKEVFVIGSSAFLDVVVKLIQRLGEEYTVSYKERLVPLEVEPKPVTKYRPGDAIIAFSRKEVLRIAESLKQQNKSTSVIYGALSPEVRRQQAKKFCDGINEILVSTDAIGMGLNLPISRIIFSQIEKFDGYAPRYLSPTEVKQIGGRAGRFGKFEKGTVAAASEFEIDYIRNAIEFKDSPILGIFVAPNYNHVETISKELHTLSLSQIYGEFQNTFKEDFFFPVVTEEMFYASSLVDDILGNSSELRLRYKLSFAPIDKATYGRFSEYVYNVKYIKKFGMPQPPKYILTCDPLFDKLEEAENYSKLLTLYSWFSFKFPELTTTKQNVLSEYREKVSEFIDKTLTTKMRKKK